jgi:hypothetical protein
MSSRRRTRSGRGSRRPTDAGRRTDGMTTAEQEKLRRLRKENKQLRLEREITCPRNRVKCRFGGRRHGRLGSARVLFRHLGPVNYNRVWGRGRSSGTPGSRRSTRSAAAWRVDWRPVTATQGWNRRHASGRRISIGRLRKFSTSEGLDLPGRSAPCNPARGGRAGRDQRLHACAGDRQRSALAGMLQPHRFLGQGCRHRAAGGSPRSASG